MSEFAHERLERLLPIFEELQRVQLFTNEEVKRVIKKCKSLEHKLEKRVKDKNDFIRYSQYLIYFFALIRERRRSLKYWYKKKEIDYAVCSKIESVLGAACSRFQGDIGLWLSRIEFAKTQHLHISVSRIYVRLLQVHSDKPHLWIAAAKWEFEENGSAENARGLLQRGIRFNSKCSKLYLELFRLELLYIGKLMDRRDALKSGGTAKVSEGDDDCSSPAKEEEVSDSVMKGKLAQIVFDEAVEKFPGDVNLCTDFAKIALEFPFCSELVDYIYEKMDTTYENSEERWVATAERQYTENPTDIDACKAIFEKAVSQLNTPKMWLCYLQFYLDHLEDRSVDRKKVSDQCLEVFTKAAEQAGGILDEELYKKWISLVPDISLRSEIAEKAVSTHPRSVDLWECVLRCRISMGSSEKEIMKNFNRAVALVPEKESLCLWQLALNWAVQICPWKVEKLLKAASIFDSTVSGPLLKMVYLDWILITKGMDTVRAQFRRLCLHKPNSLDFYMSYYEMERSQVTMDVDGVRNCFEQAVYDHGNSCPQVWLSYVEFELRAAEGDPGNVTGIYSRAIKGLRSEKVEDFMRDYMLLMKQ